MTSAERNALRAQLIQDIDALQKDIAELTDVTRPIAPENAIGRVSRMDAINNRSINEAALRDARIRLAKLQKALKKIDRPDFGRCAACGEPIALERLRALPTATRCMSCMP